jgi:hypothetical protein
MHRNAAGITAHNLIGIIAENTKTFHQKCGKLFGHTYVVLDLIWGRSTAISTCSLTWILIDYCKCGIIATVLYLPAGNSQPWAKKKRNSNIGKYLLALYFSFTTESITPLNIKYGTVFTYVIFTWRDCRTRLSVVDVLSLTIRSFNNKKQQVSQCLEETKQMYYLFADIFYTMGHLVTEWCGMFLRKRNLSGKRRRGDPLRHLAGMSQQILEEFN